MIRISEKRAPLIFGIIQAGLTSLVASGVGIYRLGGLASDFTATWLGTWLTAWAMMLPVVIFAAPHIQRIVVALIRASNR